MHVKQKNARSAIEVKAKRQPDKIFQLNELLKSISSIGSPIVMKLNKKC